MQFISPLVTEKFSTINFDVCICSPLKRAFKTAKIIVDKKCDIVLEEKLVERSFGGYEGQNSKEANIDIFKLWDLKENIKELYDAVGWNYDPDYDIDLQY